MQRSSVIRRFVKSRLSNCDKAILRTGVTHSTWFLLKLVDAFGGTDLLRHLGDLARPQLPHVRCQISGPENNNCVHRANDKWRNARLVQSQWWCSALCVCVCVCRAGWLSSKRCVEPLSQLKTEPKLCPDTRPVGSPLEKKLNALMNSAQTSFKVGTTHVTPWHGKIPCGMKICDASQHPALFLFAFELGIENKLLGVLDKSVRSGTKRQKFAGQNSRYVYLQPLVLQKTPQKYARPDFRN